MDSPQSHPADAVTIKPEGVPVAAIGRLLLDAGPAGEMSLSLLEVDGTIRVVRPDGEEVTVSKRSAAEDLVRAVRAMATRPAPAPTADEADLSERELQVLKLIAVGYSNKEIAAQLVLSVKTVETYKMRSFEKLGIRSRVDLVRHAARSGWLTGL